MTPVIRHPPSVVLRIAILLTCVGCGRTGGSVDSAKGPEPALFENVVEQSGIDFRVSHTKPILNILDTVGHGVGILDADADGMMDLIFVGKDQVRLYRNLGGMKFHDVSSDSGFRQEGMWGGLAAGDYDNDGKTDLFLSGYDCSALYRNEGGARFRDVTSGSGLAVKPPQRGKTPEWRTSAGWVDYDKDGKLDLFVCRYAEFGPGTVDLCEDPTKNEKYACAPDIYKPQRPSLFRNLGNGRFQDVTLETGIDKGHGRSLGVAFGDYNDDGFVDIAVANDELPGDLFTSIGGKRFVNDGPKSGTAYSALGRVHGGMGIDWGDYDADSKLDLFVTTYENEAKNLYRNLGRGLFTDMALDAGLAEKMDRYVGWGVKFLDYDLDTRPDLIVTSGHVMNNTARIYPGTSYPQPIQLFRNLDSRYEEVTDQLGPRAQKLVAGRGLAVGDLDNDGRPDAVISNLDGPPVLLHNLTRDENRWIGFRLKGLASNRDGFGARITVITESGKQVRDASSSGSYMAAHDPRLIFGLGSSDSAREVQVLWPSGKRQTLGNLAAGKVHEVSEAEAIARK